ncbi:uncharacterized protein F4822DRAFT_306263 [Hypoxylon trugodes]|uniref:uncharacterized protein n=1 Tax=Hypoxylon trugodes TaxID=326681 RepID=UPI00219D13A4|nr:uncharacterized protein F4822DRAFT_306263 [Hypoxylon trugodes]KAI1386116.1 hypothetical protein F4822DRAFT_306263 [Hypoxylon trugodes]
MAPYSTDMQLATAVLAVNSCGLALSSISVALRFWARSIRKLQLRLSDYMIIASWLFSVGLVISENYCVTRGGVGQKMVNVAPEELLFSTKQFLVVDVCGSLAVAFVKISILDFLLSVFATQDGFRISAYILMALSAGYGLSFTIVSLAGCQPFEANWDKISYPNYTCINTSHFFIAQAGIGVTLDCLILFLPMPVVWNLSLKTSKKVALTSIFTMGIFICVISITRLAYNTNQTWMTAHFTEYGAIACILGALEANLSIVCACLPTLPPLLSAFKGRVKSSFGSNNGGIKGVFSNFSTKDRRPTRNSIKLDSTNFRPRNMSIEDDVESVRLQNQVDKLYPLNAMLASRASVEREIGWMSQTGRSYARVASTISGSSGDAALEMARLGEKVEPYSAINVTKSWRVN